MDSNIDNKKQYAISLLLVCVLTALIVIIAFPVAGSGIGGDIFTDHEDTGLDYGPDYEIPDNDFKVFYSDTENGDTDDEEFDEENFEVEDPEVGPPRSIDEILDDDYGGPEEMSRATDFSYYITPSLMEFYGWNLDAYRHNQLTGIPFDEEHSDVLEPWEDKTQNHQTIEEAYVGIVGVSPEGYPLFEFDGDGAMSPDDDRPLLVSNNGDVLTYLDFRINDEAVPDEEIDDPVTNRIPPDNRKQSQEQDRRTYVVENYDAERDLIINGDSQSRIGNSTGGVAGESLGYHDPRNQEAEFIVRGEITTEIYEYQWERTRDRIYRQYTTRVSGSSSETTRASTRASTTINHGPNSSGESISGTADSSCSAFASGSSTERVQEEFTVLDGDRTITIDESGVDVSFSGIVSGTCSGTVYGTAGSGNSTTISGTVSSSITDTISGSERKTFDYDYWDHWNAEENTDEGGWELQNTEFERSDTVNVEDSINAHITDNNELEVNQVAIEVEEGERYHSILQIESEGQDIGSDIFVNGRNIEPDELYYWSLIMFGDEVFIDSDWKAYSQTRYDEAGREVDFSNQLGVYVFSEGDGPSMTTTGENQYRNAELYGWDGDLIRGGEVYDTHENVQLENHRGAFYHTFVARNVPKPATNVISIHGTEREITDSETNLIPYVQPEVTVTHNPGTDTVKVTVTGENGEPLPGRDILVSGNEGDEEMTTNDAGEVEFDVTDGMTHVQVEVQGDEIDDLLAGDLPDVYYGSVTAQTTVGESGVPGHLYNVIMQVLFSIPLVLLYLLWRDAELGI